MPIRDTRNRILPVMGARIVNNRVTYKTRMWDASVIDTRSTTSACRSSAFRLTLSSTCVTELLWFERHHLGEVAIRGAESLGRRNWAAHNLAEIFRRHVFVIHRLSLCEPGSCCDAAEDTRVVRDYPEDQIAVNRRHGGCAGNRICGSCAIRNIFRYHIHRIDRSDSLILVNQETAIRWTPWKPRRHCVRSALHVCRVTNPQRLIIYSVIISGCDRVGIAL